MGVKCRMSYDSGDYEMSETESFFDFWDAVAHAGRSYAWKQNETTYQYISEATGEDITKPVLDAAKGATRWGKGNYSHGTGVIC